jgi:hypothetical protein
MNYNLGKVDTKPVIPRKKFNKETQKFEDDFSLIETSVEWVSHGNYALHQKKDDYELSKDNFNVFLWFEMEQEYFDQILAALESQPLPVNTTDLFEPFWKAVLPPRGMHFYETQIRAYFRDSEKNSFIMHQQSCLLSLGLTGYCPAPLIAQMGFTVEDFKKVRDVALTANAEKPFHCCPMTI